MKWLALVFALAAAQIHAAPKKFDAGDYIAGRNTLQGLKGALPIFLATGKMGKTLDAPYFEAEISDRLEKMGLSVLQPDKDVGAGIPISRLARPTLIYKVFTLESEDGTVVYYAELALREGVIGQSMDSKRPISAAMPILWSRGGLGFITQSKLQTELGRILDQLLALFNAEYDSVNNKPAPKAKATIQ